MFNFSYDSTSDKHGYTDSNGTFIPFESGGTDVSDTTATAANVLRGYYFYTADGTKTQGSIYTRSASNITVTGSKTYSAGYYPNAWTVSGLDTSSATAYAKNIEKGYTAYARGSKITGTANVIHTLAKYTGSISGFNYARSSVGSASIGDYAIFAGGSTRINDNYNYYTTYCDCYNSDLTRTSRTLAYESGNLIGTNNPSHAVFTGSSGSGSTTILVIAFNSSLTQTTPSTRTGSNYNPHGSNIGNYCLFSDGDSEYDSKSIVETYDTSLTRSTATSLSNARGSIGTTKNNNYAIFAGGNHYQGNYYYTFYDTIDYYNTSLTKSSAYLPSVRCQMKGTKVGSYAILGGGYKTDSYNSNNPVYYKNVYSYGSSMTRSELTPLSNTSNTYRLNAVSVSNYGLFNYDNDTVVDVYSDALSKSSITPLDYSGQHFVGSNPNYAFFYYSQLYSNPQGNVMEAYYIS